MLKDPRAARTATPYWWEAAPPAALPTEALPAKVDVAIVGAGYAGLTFLFFPCACVRPAPHTLDI